MRHKAKKGRIIINLNNNYTKKHKKKYIQVERKKRIQFEFFSRNSIC